MLSISAPRTAGGATSYYMHMEKDSTGQVGEYYAKEGEAGYWMGQGAGQLGLDGRVNGEAFKALCQGFDQHGEALTKNAGDPERRAGWDLTFSAPKSVSVAWSVADPQTRAAIEKAHAQAVAHAFELIQEKAGFARTGAQGQTHMEGGLVAAAFQHGTSREQDAQLHTHVFVMNAAIIEGRNAASVASELLFEYKMAGGAAYQCTLAHELGALGYQLERDGEDTFRLAAVPKALEVEQSTRRQQIEAHMAENGTTGAAAAAVATLATRTAKGDIDLGVLRERWIEQASAHGFSAAQARPDFQQQPTNQPTKELPHERANTQHHHIDRRNSPKPWPGHGQSRAGGLPERYFANAKGIGRAQGLGQIQSLHSVRTLQGQRLDEIRGGSEVLLQSNARHRLEPQRNEQLANVRRDGSGAVDKQIQRPTSKDVLEAATQHDAIIRDSHIVTQAYRLGIMASTPTQAKALAERAKTKAVEVKRLDGKQDRKGQTFTTRELIRAENEVMRVAVDRRAETRHMVPAETVQAAAARTAEAKGYELNQEQKAALAKLCCAPGGVQVLVGDAGTGKSTTMYALREANEAAGLTVLGASTGGKASAELMASAGIESRSLAKLIADMETGKLSLNTSTVLVIDEAGMTDSRAMSTVMLKAEEAGAKVILVGDHKQLQPVGAGETFRHVAEKIGAARLADNQRQLQSWERSAVQDMSKGEAEAALAKYIERDRVTVEPTFRKAIDDIADRQVKNIQEVGAVKTVALAGTNVAVNEINQAVREQLKAQGYIQDSRALETLGSKGQSQQIEIGTNDRIMIGTTDHKAGTLNGDTGTVVSVDQDRGLVTVKLDRVDATVEIKADEAKLRHAYAITTHKSQGSTYERATVYLVKETSREMSYVQASRAREETHFVTSTHTLKEMGDKVPATEELRVAVKTIAEAKEAAGKASGLQEDTLASFSKAVQYIEKNQKFAPDTAQAVTKHEQLQALGRAMSIEKPKESTLDYREVSPPRPPGEHRQAGDKQSEKQFTEALNKLERAMESRENSRQNDLDRGRD